MKVSSNGQWSLLGSEDTLLFKTSEKQQAGKNEVIERKKIDPNGEEAKAIFDKFAKAIINDTPRQPTDEQMFGHLVVSEEQVQKAEQAWNGVFNKFYDSSAEPLEKQDSIDNLEWGNGKSFNDSIEEEELQKRNMHVE